MEGAAGRGPEVLMPVVLDCSVALMWAFQDEATDATNRFLDRLTISQLQLNHNSSFG